MAVPCGIGLIFQITQVSYQDGVEQSSLSLLSSANVLYDGRRVV